MPEVGELLLMEHLFHKRTPTILVEWIRPTHQLQNGLPFANRGPSLEFLAGHSFVQLQINGNRLAIEFVSNEGQQTIVIYCLAQGKCFELFQQNRSNI